MPPRKKKKQPELDLRLEVSEWITENLSHTLKPIGGFTVHRRPIKGNHLDHNLLFGVKHKNLEPASTAARIWRIHPMEHLVRLNALICNEPEYDPDAPGKRTRGDRIVANRLGELKVFFGLERYIGHIGGNAAYAASVTGFPAIFTTTQDHGLRDYPFMYTVNSSEAAQIVSVAEPILKFMAYGPDAKPYQFADSMEDIADEHKVVANKGLPTGIFYSKEIKRPLTPIYDLMKEPGVSDARLIAAINYLFEALTLRKPTEDETSSYLTIVKNSINDLGKEDGVFLGLAPIFLDRDALFRPELVETGVADKYGRRMLQGQELILAVNHAFSFIMPDGKLNQALNEGRFKTREDVKREIVRILNDDSIRKPRILQFFREYFDYDLCAKVCKDDNALKKAAINNGKLHYSNVNSMVGDTDRLIELILQEDKNVLKELLTTDRVVYGGSGSYFGYEPQEGTPKRAEGESKDDFAKRKKAYNTAQKKAKKSSTSKIFPGENTPINVRYAKYLHGGKRTLSTLNKTQRLGILTHPSWLIAHSDAMDNHAILRGRWVRERLLGDAVPDVPITVDAMLPDEPNETLRHRMRVTLKEECWRCHQKMDPLGLPFEMYNHLGMLRKTEQGKPVNTSGEIFYSGDPNLDGKVSDALDMIEKLAASERVEQVFVRHVFRYWMGRNETINDAPILQAAHRAYKENGGSMKALLISLLTSDAFLYRTR